MAKVKNPLMSIRASGKIGQALRYSHQRGQDRVTSRRTGTAALKIGQRRQASVISEAARLWRTRDGAGPEKTYQEYVRGVSANSWYFMYGDVLLEWSEYQLMPAG